MKKYLLLPGSIFYKLSGRFQWILFIVLGSIINLSGQKNINFTLLTTKDGLSSNSVNEIIKDHTGLMWFGTEDGLNKFDGIKFTVYRNNPKDSNSLQSNEILALHEDKKGNLWVGTGGGSLSLYDRKLDKFINFPANNTPATLHNNVVNSVCSDHKGNIWVGTYTGINIIDPATRKISELKALNRASFTETTLSLFEDSKHQMWIGTNAGLFCFDPSTNLIKKFTHNPANKHSLPSDVIRTIAEDSSGNIWLGTKAGLCRKISGEDSFNNFQQGELGSNPILHGNFISMTIDSRDNIWMGTTNGLGIFNNKTGQISNHYFNPRIPQSLSVNFIQSVFIDKQNICWIGTVRGGINIYDKNLTLFNLVRSNPFDEKSLPAKIVTSFTEGENGQIYVGTDPGGISLFDPKSRSFKRFKLNSQTEQTKEGLTVTSLAFINKNELLVGTWESGLLIFNPATGSCQQMLKGNQPNSLSSNDINCIKKDRYGNKWVGTNGEGVCILNPDNQIIARYLAEPKYSSDKKLPVNGYVRDILEDKQGNIWLATHGGGLSILNPVTNTFTNFTQGNSGLPADKVSTLLLDKKGNIWAGTFGGGIALYNPQKNNFTVWSEKDSLANNNVFKLVEDQKGRIWISTNKGLSSFNVATKKFTNYSTHNGLQHNSFIQGSGILTSNGNLYFGGLEGFNFFDPESQVTNKNIPTVLFTDLRIANKSVTPSNDGPIRENISIAREIDIEYKQSFALSFVGLNFTAPEQNKYAYKLEGYDTGWNLSGNINAVSYTNLSPGEYTLRVRASNNDGLWNLKGNSIKISVHPPFWRSNFAYLLYFILFFGGLLIIRHRGIQKIKSKYIREQEKMHLEQARREAERIHELDLLKIKFLTNLSHEFRTPISLILGPIDTLIEKEKDLEPSSHMKIIKRNARRLLNLVNQLLDFRKLEEQELKLNRAEGELITFIRDVADSFSDLSDRKKIDLECYSYISELNTCFDHDKLERILFNLLSNAFKFTLEGGKIKLQVKKSPEQPDDSIVWVQIQVTDNGIGVPLDKQEKIFEHFFQADHSTSIINQGSGIGLSITKEFCHLLGGDIQVKSTPGEGSTFTVCLPFKVSAGLTTETELPSQFDINSDILKENGDVLINGDKVEQDIHKELPILLVEDNDDFRFFLKDNLKVNYHVLEASNGKEGWQKALAQHPQLIISDINMPVMDGIELCKKIKADKRTKHIPVILLTALTGEQDHLKGLATGANDYITKPFNFEVLNAKVKNLLDLNKTLKLTYTRQFKVLTPDIKITSDDERLMNNIMAYLDENLTDLQLSVETLSRHIGMSRSSLYSKLLEITGQTPVEFIRSVKLERAAELLKKSDMNIAQIAYSVGFATPNYFAKSFKAKYNMLPSEFAAAAKEKNKSRTI